MKLDQLGITTTTSFSPVHPIHGETGIVITGHTPDSKTYKQVERKHTPPPKSTTMYVGKKGESRVELKNDPNAAEKRLNKLAEIVTSITGIDDWTFSTEATTELFHREDCQWIVDQWEDHLDDRSNFTQSSTKTARPPSKSSHG